jgi:Protein of unknown function (DUF2934)
VTEPGALPDSSFSRPPRSAEELHNTIRKRAEEIYLRNGSVPGRDLENWAQAEVEIMQELEHLQPRNAVVIEVNGVKYVGEYDPNACDGYAPGEFNSGAQISVRFEGQKMFVKRPNGRELETLIVEKI